MLPPRKSGPFSMPCRVSRTQKITKVNFLEQMGKERLRGWGGGGVKAWSRARSRLAN